MNRSAVMPDCFQYPRPRPTPPMYNSPVPPIGTGSNLASRTNAVLFRTGRPIGGLLPSAVHSANVAELVISVGPYAFKKRRSGAHLRTSSSGHASPPEMSVARQEISSHPMVANNEGGNATVVIAYSLINFLRLEPSKAISSSTT